MGRITTRRPSPTMLVALVALVAAFAGESVAGVATKALTKKEKKQIKKIARKQANKRINARAPGLSVANATNAINATNAANATNAENATNAASVAPGSIGSLEVSQLRAVDISSVHGFKTINFGSIPAGECKTDTIDAGRDVESDLLLVSVDDTADFANGGLTVHASDSSVAEKIRVNVCNVTGAAIDPPSAVFNYMVIRH